MLAYVDDCLSPEDRLAFERRMAEDAAIRSRVEEWLFQNEAIRAAFPDRPTKAGTNVASRPADAGCAPAWAPASVGPLGEVKVLARLPRADGRAAVPRAAPNSRPAGRAKQRNILRTAAFRALRVLAAAITLWIAIAFVFANNPSSAFVTAGAAAYRTFAQNATRPVEIATADSDVASKWIAPQIARALPVPDLAAMGLILLGGRVVPGADSPASFALYENARRDRIGLYVETLDAPPASKAEVKPCGDLFCASWTGAGHGFVLIGHNSAAVTIQLTRIVDGSTAGI
jgi:anti-sigma factor RsiW